MPPRAGLTETLIAGGGGGEAEPQPAEKHARLQTRKFGKNENRVPRLTKKSSMNPFSIAP